ncbi:hypothetical protein HN011_000603 [Eciton burchellii]|nr:hypothetical protein HN011_000603 [Eciton burchellii]
MHGYLDASDPKFLAPKSASESRTDIERISDIEKRGRKRRIITRHSLLTRIKGTLVVHYTDADRRRKKQLSRLDDDYVFVSSFYVIVASLGPYVRIQQTFNVAFKFGRLWIEVSGCGMVYGGLKYREMRQ